jgi:hypothetical protein
MEYIQDLVAKPQHFCEFAVIAKLDPSINMRDVRTKNVIIFGQHKCRGARST